MIFLSCFALIITGCKSNSEKSGASANQVESNIIQADENTPEYTIHEASLNGQYDVVMNLLSEDVNVNATDPVGRTPLMYAAYNGHLEIAKALIDKGATVDMKDLYGRTALMFASTGPYTETVQLLLDHHADPNMTDTEEHFTALMYAAAEGQLEVVKLLLDNNADPAMLDADGDDAETFARNNGHIEVAELLAGARQ